ncbi:Crp/Fnr family transcriptional regulator [Paramagnetospirillum kuznetsovii]|uniref:Crp/Fnr family transcriptional regulator n=1 Tax=Paramagnetospirillum kuznetsovii TaxID=2053833 RepID=A0A364NYY8_9PROT|nr:Crp/Fnr family transcriptional regulator [Paramagnetospirillum kuznetsovii]RAU22289.1 Crp/Fnr family transcriptional regulator [Paramagnetospirillum kuznetsovii]
MRDTQIQAAWYGLDTCEKCAIRHLVLFADLKREDFSAVHLPIEDLWLAPGTELYGQDQSAEAVFTIREGLVKLEQYLPDGGRRIVSLLGQGDVAGLEATLAPAHEHAAVALVPTKVCRIPKPVIDRLSPKLHRQLMTKWHDMVLRSHQCARELSTGSARQRVARLILLLGLPGAPTCRLFGRDDVGALLGITTETACRMISDFKRRKLVEEIAPNQFRRDVAALQAIADGQ